MARQDAFFPYEPLNTLKPVAEDAWIVDGPEIRFGMAGLKLPFPTRMTILRLEDGGLFVHSPTRMTSDLKAAVDALGPVRFIIAPNTIHYWHAPDWKAAYPQSRLFAAPGLQKKAKRDVPVDAELGDRPPAEWTEEIDQVLFLGSVMNEVDFFHRASRTAILTDLIENFEPKRIKNPFFRFLVKVFGAADPNGSTPIDMRASFRNRTAMRDGVDRMIAWDPARVILAHGRWYPENGTAELKRAFRWV